MGQYYNAVIKTKGKKEVFYHQVDGEYMLAKLMEHSYYGNPFVLAVASKLWRTKGKLAWVGDYAEESDFNWNEEFSDAHEENVPKKNLKYNGFRLEGKTFINHDKKMFIDLDEYKDLFKDKHMIPSPIPLLTAVGNGKGGGDFVEGRGYDLIGTWAWDTVEITDQDLYDWTYNSKKNEYIRTLKKVFSEYTNVTKKYLFIEKI